MMRHHCSVHVISTKTFFYFFILVCLASMFVNNLEPAWITLGKTEDWRERHERRNLASHVWNRETLGKRKLMIGKGSGMCAHVDVDSVSFPLSVRENHLSQQRVNPQHRSPILAFSTPHIPINKMELVSKSISSQKDLHFKTKHGFCIHRLHQIQSTHSNDVCAKTTDQCIKTCQIMLCRKYRSMHWWADLIHQNWAHKGKAMQYEHTQQTYSCFRFTWLKSSSDNLHKTPACHIWARECSYLTYKDH